jgi:hypothetical protein
MIMYAKRPGRTIGVMLLLQLVGFILPFVLLHPLMSADYIANAANYSFQIKAAVLLFFANGALTVGISIASWPFFKQYSEPMAMWLIVLSVIMFVLQASDNIHIMSMLSLSQQFVDAGSPAAQYDAIAGVVRTTRRWSHYPELFAIDFWIMLFQVILLRFSLVPRPLAVFSLSTMVLHFVAVPLSGFLGYGINTTLGVPMAFGLLAISVWLIANGFRDPVAYNDELT